MFAIRCMGAIVVGILAPFANLHAQAPNVDPHLKLNPLYRELRDPGVALDRETAEPLVAPLMPSQLTAKEQMEVLRKLVGDDFDIDDVTRESVVAPHVFKIRDLAVKDPNFLGRGTTLWFCAHGSFEKIDHRALVDLFQGYRRDTQLTFLKDAELKERGITRLKNDDIEESYCRASYAILERVQTHGTYRIMTSRTADSVVLSVRLEPSFLRDQAMPNIWQALTPDDTGALKAGPAKPYSGMGTYTRITRMKEPKGLLFVESHQVFAEPKSWFDSPNVLRSKLPLVVQSDVRAFRRQLLKLDR
ncbi:MAG: hypothetical protein K8T89_01415 [Planctomycetes bacterium]|nr:hypothetical protein [Planctomycetota bacterium]